MVFQHNARLKKGPFQHLGEKEWERVKGEGKWEVFQDGQVILPPGSVVEAIFYLVSGSAKIFRPVSSREKELLAILAPGELVGLKEALFHEPCHQEVIAVKEASGLWLSPGLLVDLMHRNTQIRFDVMQSVIQAIKEIDERLMTCTLASEQERFAGFLLYVQDKVDEAFCSSNDGFPLTIQEMAHLSGCSLEQVNGLIQAFARKGILEYRNAHLRVVDLEQLHRVREGKISLFLKK